MKYNNIIIEYQKITSWLDNVSNQPSNFRTKNWVKINYDSQGTYNINEQIKFKTTSLIYVITVMHTYLLKE